MLQIKNTNQSLTVSEGQNTVSVVVKNGKFVFYQSVVSSVKLALQLQNTIKDYLQNRVDKKRSFDQRISQLAKILKNSNSNSFRQLLNRL